VNFLIFGFNTDIRYGDTVYHVQSEAREAEHLLQTQVFVRGQCIGKRAIPYALSSAQGAASGAPGWQDAPSTAPGATDVRWSDDQEREKRLRELHRQVLEAIRDGQLDSVLDKRDTPEMLAAVKELDLHWVNAQAVLSGGALVMRIRVTDGGRSVSGARLTLRLARAHAVPYYAQVLTDAAGNAEVSVHVDEAELAAASVLVQASFEGRTATRKFALQPAV
jgi:hypothetical protein